MPIVTNLEKKFNNKQKFPTSKIVGIVLLVVATIGYIGLFIRWIPFLHDFLVGTFGLFSYALFLVMYFVGAALLKGAKYVYAKRYLVYLILALISVLAIFHIAFTFTIDLSNYGSYLAEIYSSGLSVGGVLLGLIIFPLQKFLYPIGAIFLFIVILAVCIWLIYDYLTRVRYLKQTDTKIFNKKVEKIKHTTISFEQPSASEKTKIGLDAEIEQEQLKREQTVANLGLNQSVKNEHFVDNRQLNTFANEFLNEQPANSPKKLGRLEPTTDYSGTFGYNIMNTPKSKPKSSNYDKNREFLEATLQTSSYIPPKNAEPVKELSVSDFLNANFGTIKQDTPVNNNNDNVYSNDYNTVSAAERTFETTSLNEETNKLEESSERSTLFDNVTETASNDTVNSNDVNQTELENTIEEIDLKNFELPASLKLATETRRSRAVKHNENQTSLFDVNLEPVKVEKPVRKHTRYVPPTIDLLTNVSTDASSYNENCEANAIAIETTLNNFGIPAKVINTVVGPAVTRYELNMPAGISVNKVAQYSNDIAMAVAASKGVRIQAPIPGKSAVGVEIPNQKVAMVGIREILESKEFLYNKHSLSFAVGKEVDGKKVVADMKDLRHMLVAGSTGSGKSVALNTIIISMLYKYSPADLRFIFVDPKQVEFYMYNNIPHLLMPEVIVDPVKAINALNWVIDEMERRYTLMRDNDVREIDEYNSLPEVKDKQKEKLPQIVVVLDEVGDLMAIPQIKKDLEERIIRLTQKARAAGIFLILATQRPSTDVITGVIKANLPSRMAFAVTNFQDSNTILARGGAEKLLGKGDCLFAPQGLEPYRVQGCYISNSEIKNVLNFIKQHNESYYDESISEAINKKEEPEVSEDIVKTNDTGFDPLMPEALKLVIKNGYASASMLQRRFSIGNPKAARIIDQMEVAKFIGPPNGSKPRAVYITAEQFKEIFGEGIDD